MALMERVATLLRANINDLIDRAEDPEKMLKQLVLDMENQLLQVKTQVAIALADQHLLEKKRNEHQETAANWQAKAELAVGKGEDELARAALERGLSSQNMAESFSKQVTEQASETEALRTAYNKLQGKLKETQAQCEILLAQHRRARMVSKATAARQVAEDKALKAMSTGTINRFKARLQNSEAENEAGKAMLDGDTVEDRFATLERDEKVERLLDELKRKQAHMLGAG